MLHFATPNDDPAFWVTWGPSLTSILVALLALGGVVWSTYKSAEASRHAEDRRAEATIEAENRRAASAVAAEDQRHANGLSADQRRYEQAVALERDHRTAETRHDLYIQIESARRRLVKALSLFTFYTDGDPDDWWFDASPRYLAELNEAFDIFEAMQSEATLYASEAVSQRAYAVFGTALQLKYEAEEFAPKRLRDGSDAIHNYALTAQKACEQLLARMREELGAA